MARRRKLLWSGAIALCGALVVGVGIGFIAFARSVAEAEVPADPRADGIVVFTGGYLMLRRLPGAIELALEGLFLARRVSKASGRGESVYG